MLLSTNAAADYCGRGDNEDAREIAMEEIEFGFWPNAIGEQTNRQSRHAETLQRMEQMT